MPVLLVRGYTIKCKSECNQIGIPFTSTHLELGPNEKVKLNHHFKIISHNFLNFLLNWAEWESVSIIHKHYFLKMSLENTMNNE